MSTRSETISAATGIGTFGWPVFPVNRKTKAPLIAEWQSRASSNSCEIERLFRNYPDAAIGLVTGQRSGLVGLILMKGKILAVCRTLKTVAMKSHPQSVSTPRGAFIYTQLHRLCSVSKIAEGGHKGRWGIY